MGRNWRHIRILRLPSRDKAGGGAVPVGGGRLQGASDEAAGGAGDGPEEGAGQPRRSLREAPGLGRSMRRSVS